MDFGNFNHGTNIGCWFTQGGWVGDKKKIETPSFFRISYITYIINIFVFLIIIFKIIIIIFNVEKIGVEYDGKIDLLLFLVQFKTFD